MAAGQLLLEDRLRQAEIARRMGVSLKAVSNWAKQLRARGLEGLRRRPRAGRRVFLITI